MKAFKCIRLSGNNFISLGMFRHRMKEYTVGKAVLAPETWLRETGCGLFVFDTFENAYNFLTQKITMSLDS